jgi:hypothetical protein
MPDGQSRSSGHNCLLATALRSPAKHITMAFYAAPACVLVAHISVNRVPHHAAHLKGTVPSHAMAWPSNDISTSSALRCSAAAEVGLTRLISTPAAAHAASCYKSFELDDSGTCLRLFFSCTPAAYAVSRSVNNVLRKKMQQHMQQAAHSCGGSWAG